MKYIYRLIRLPHAAHFVACLLLLVLIGCAEPARTTRPTIADFQEMAEAMAQSLTRSPALAHRSADSEPWVVSIDKVLNLSSDVMTPAEQWAIMADLRSSVPLQTLRNDKNIRFVLPPERVVAMRDDPDAAEFADIAAHRQPTHTMTATFRSVVRAQSKTRTDLYYCEFQILDLRTGEPMWTDKFEFKRQAMGSVRD